MTHNVPSYQDTDHFLQSLGLDREHLLSLEPLDQGVTAVYVSGSLVEGLGNVGSDVDIFVVGDAQPTRQTAIWKELCAISIHYHGRRRIDFEYWREAHVDNIAARLDKIRIGQEFVAEKLEPIEELFIHRVKIALPMSREDGLRALQAKFDFDKFGQYLAQQAVHRIDGGMEDVLGMIDSGDWKVGVLRARELVGLAIDAYRHALGHTNSLPKWRPKVLDELATDDFGQSVRRRFWELQFPPLSMLEDERQCAAYMEECVRFANSIVEWVQR